MSHTATHGNGTADDEDEDPEMVLPADGDPIQCRECTAPVVVYFIPTAGYRLVCGCPGTAVSIDAVAGETTAFAPPTGKWAPLDDFDGWD